ncbi:hypothetical protein SDC9_176853 [bioreactor metagenome]|uniref:Uncharacterized protein n=1 Tax=bioreactor metagenome TaxID=1076179 RepID=A0A645GSY3_9ZZZZ
MAAGDPGIYMADLAVGHQFDFLDDAADRVHRLLDIDHDPLLQPARILRAHADHAQPSLVVDIGDQRDDLRRSDIQANHQILVVPAHSLTFPSHRQRPSSRNHSDTANPRLPAVPANSRPSSDKPRQTAAGASPP